MYNSAIDILIYYPRFNCNCNYLVMNITALKMVFSYKINPFILTVAIFTPTADNARFGVTHNVLVIAQCTEHYDFFCWCTLWPTGANFVTYTDVYTIWKETTKIDLPFFFNVSYILYPLCTATWHALGPENSMGKLWLQNSIMTCITLLRSGESFTLECPVTPLRSVGHRMKRVV